MEVGVTSQLPELSWAKKGETIRAVDFSHLGLRLSLRLGHVSRGANSGVGRRKEYCRHRWLLLGALNQ